MSDVTKQALPKKGMALTTPDNNDAAIRGLADWFIKNNGHLSPDVEIAYDTSMGFHVRAVRPLASSIVVRCPLTLTISHLNLDHSQSVVPHVDSPLRKCLGQIPNKVLTYLLLIEQRCLAERGNSAWQPYFDCLPKSDDMTTTLWFSDEELEYLQGTDLYQATFEKKMAVAQEFEDTVNALTRLGIKPEHDKLNYELYLWAFTIMSSRSFVSTYMLPTVDTFPILFPVLDILNHMTEAKVKWNFQEASFALEVIDRDSIHPGDQIYNNYAPKQNGELLLGYGFVIPNNPIEQFAIKMSLPPEMTEAARDLGFYKSKNVPFGMPRSLLDGHGEEDNFLRPRGHPFGRYENDIPWLQGFPPWIVHSAFVATCMQLGHTPKDIDARKPAGIVVLQLLLQLYTAVRVKASAFPLNVKETSDPSNSNQRHAEIYRAGQSKVIHYMRRELQAVIANLRVHNTLPPPKPVILTTTEALIALQAEHPTHYTHFTNALENVFDMQITPAPSPSQLAQNEKDIWTILLFVFAHLSLTTPNPAGLIHDWVLEWLEIHTLPSIASLSIPEGFDENVLGSFVLDAPKPVSQLNDIPTTLDQATLDARFADLPVWDDDDDEGVNRLGDKILAWASEVVEIYGFEMHDGGLGDGDGNGKERFGMYMRPYREKTPVEESWVYDDVEVPDV